MTRNGNMIVWFFIR